MPTSSIEDLDLAHACDELRRRLIRHTPLSDDHVDQFATAAAVTTTLRRVRQRRHAEGRQVGAEWVGRDGDTTTLTSEYTWVIACLAYLDASEPSEVAAAVESLEALAEELWDRATAA